MGWAGGCQPWGRSASSAVAATPRRQTRCLLLLVEEALGGYGHVSHAKRHFQSRSALISSSVGSRPSRFRNRSMVVSVNSISLPPLWFRLLVASPCVRDLLLWSMPSCA